MALKEIREKYPQYNNLTDAQLLNALGKKIGSSKKNEPIKKQSSLQENLLRYGVKDPLIGLTKFGENLVNAPHNLTALVSERAASHVPKLEEMDYSSIYGINPQEKNVADEIIQFAPELAASVAVPATRLGSLGRSLGAIPKAGKYLKTGLENAVSQGALAASQSPQDQREAALTAGAIAGPFSALSKATREGSPALRRLSKLLLGGGAGVLGYQGAKQVGAPEGAADVSGILSGILGYRGINAKRQASQNLLKGLEGTNYKDVIDASKRLGLSYVTPAEASGNPFTGAAQGSIGKTEKGAQLLYEKGKERLSSEKKSINKLLDTTFNKDELDPKVTKLYEVARPQEIEPEKLANFKDNEVFKRAVKLVQNVPAYKESLKGVSENSVDYLDHVKQAMDDMIEKAPSKQGRIIQKTRKSLLDVLDTSVPEYKEARGLAEREIARRSIEEAFNKKEMTGSNFAEFLKNEKDYKSLLHNLRNVPEAQEQLKDMKLVFKRLINIPTAKTAEALHRSGMAKERNDSQLISKLQKEFFTGGKYDEAAVELITDPKWHEQLSKLKDITKSEKVASKLYDLLSKAGAQGVAQKKKESIMKQSDDR